MSTRLEEEIGMRDFEDICENVESTITNRMVERKMGYSRDRRSILRYNEVDGEIRHSAQGGLN